LPQPQTVTNYNHYQPGQAFPVNLVQLTPTGANQMLYTTACPIYTNQQHAITQNLHNLQSNYDKAALPQGANVFDRDYIKNGIQVMHEYFTKKIAKIKHKFDRHEKSLDKNVDQKKNDDQKKDASQESEIVQDAITQKTEQNADMNKDAVQVQKSKESADTTVEQPTSVEKIIITDKNSFETAETDVEKAGQHVLNQKHKSATDVEEDETSKNTASYAVMDSNASAENQETNMQQKTGKISGVQTNDIEEVQSQEQAKESENRRITEEKNVLQQGASMIMHEDCNIPMPVAEEKHYDAKKADVKAENAFLDSSENIADVKPIPVVDSNVIENFNTAFGYKKPAIASQQNDSILYHSDEISKSEVDAYDQDLPPPEQYDEKEISALELFYSRSSENLDLQKDLYNLREENAQGLETIAENENEIITDYEQPVELNQESAKAISNLTLNEDNSCMVEFEDIVYAEFFKRMNDALQNGELSSIKNYADALRSEFISDDVKVKFIADIEKQIYALIRAEITKK